MTYRLRIYGIMKDKDPFELKVSYIDAESDANKQFLDLVKEGGVVEHLLKTYDVVTVALGKFDREWVETREVFTNENK